MTPLAASELLGCSLATVYRLVASVTLRNHGKNGLVRLAASQVRAFARSGRLRSPGRPRGCTPQSRALAAAVHGEPLRAAAKRLGVAYHTLRGIVRRVGLEKQREDGQ